MSYTIHNFQPGHKLMASELNEMDGQILANESTMEGLQAQIDSLGGYMDEKICSLSIDADEEYLYLYNGETQIAETPLSALSGSVIECTALAVTSDNPMQIAVGEGTATVTATKTPSDCTQSIVYATSNPAMVQVSSAGVVTPIAPGRAVIYARCGGKQVAIPASIGKKYSPTGRISGTAIWRFGETPQRYTMSAPQTNAYKLAFTIADGLVIPPGFTATISVDSYLRLEQLAYLSPLSGGFVVTDTTEYIVSNCTGVQDQRSIKSSDNDTYITAFRFGGTITYANTGESDKYIVLSAQAFQDDQSTGGKTNLDLTPEMLSTWAGKITVIIRPTEE